jgi:hypothetical protein
VGVGSHAQNQVDDVAQRDVVAVRAEIAAPAHVEADAIGRDAAQGVVERVDAERGERVVLGNGHLRIDLPRVGQIGIVDL